MTRYDLIREVKQDRFIVIKDNLCGVVDNKGNIIIPLEYDSIFYYEGFKLFKVYKLETEEYLTGLFDKDGNCLIPVENDEVCLFGMLGPCSVVRSELKGCFSISKNEYIIPCIYKDVDLYEEMGIWLVETVDGKYGVYDIEGREILAPVSSKVYIVDGVIIYEINGRFGAINVQKETVIPFIYSNISIQRDNKLKYEIDGKFGIMNFKGERFPILTENYIEYLGNEFNCCKYVDANSSLLGMVDLNGNILCEPKYTSINVLGKNALLCSQGVGRVGVIDNNGKEIIPNVYTHINYNGASNTFTVYDEKLKVGITDNIGKVLLECKYDEISELNVPFAMYTIGDKRGMLILEGKEVTPAIYDYIEYTEFVNGECYKTYSCNSVGLITADGRTLLEPIYDDILEIHDTYSEVELNGVLGRATYL